MDNSHFCGYYLYKMTDRLRLNGELLREWIMQESVKHAYVSRRLGCSDSYVDKMLAGRVPGEKMLERLANLIGVKVEDLLTPEEAKRA